MFLRALTLGIAATLLAQPAIGELWLWTDANGVVRYTSHPERIPSAQRAAAARVEPGMKLPATPPDPGEAAVAGVPALYAPPDEISFASDPFNAPGQARDLRVDDVAEPGGSDPWETSREPWEASREQQPPAGTTAAAGAAGASGAGAATPAASPATPTPPRGSTTAAAIGATAAAAPRAPEPPRPPPVLSADQKQRKADLEQLIERDQDTLKALISAVDAEDLETSAALREIAQRLPGLQAELRALERGESEPTEPTR